MPGHFHEPMPDVLSVLCRLARAARALLGLVKLGGVLAALIGGVLAAVGGVLAALVLAAVGGVLLAAVSCGLALGGPLGLGGGLAVISLRAKTGH